jgi:hypothetical protein
MAGCSFGPHAPALEKSSVYNNPKAGLRFLVPEDWSQTAHGDVPDGKLQQERILVEYKLLTSDQESALHVACVDLALATDLDSYLIKRSYPAHVWRRVPAERHPDEGKAGKRYLFISGPPKDETANLVVAFRRGDRVYFFTGIFQQADTKARDQIERVLESLVWTD